MVKRYYGTGKISNELGIGENMVIQNFLFPDEVCDVPELYFRTTGIVTNIIKGIKLSAGEMFQTDTYINAMNIGHWKKYTVIEEVSLELEVQGDFQLVVELLEKAKRKKLVYEHEYYIEKQEIISVPIPKEIEQGILYWKICAKSDVQYYGARYVTSDLKKKSDVRLALNICTYHRQQQLQKNLQKISDSLFFRPQTDFYGKMQIFVIDNGQDYVSPIHNEYLKVFKNPNTGGGTGGFTRGLEEIKKEQKRQHYTHVIFMDDDVEFQMESFYRLYAFLSLLKREYEDNPIAGRMFRLDNRNIQYTAVEQWNKGNIVHVGGNLNMCRQESLLEENSTGDYGGWWFCTYPIQCILQGRPFPFFIHCDDVEFGLRQRKETLTLPGVQVWHETYEYRMNPIIIYYDIRNTLVVNALRGNPEDSDMFIKEWKTRLTEFHNGERQDLKYLCTLAMWHFCSRKIFRKYQGRIPCQCVWLSKKKTILKFVTPVFHRITESRVTKQYLHIVKKYKEDYKRNYGSTS